MTDYLRLQTLKGGAGLYSASGGMRFSAHNAPDEDSVSRFTWDVRAPDDYPIRANSGPIVLMKMGFGTDAGGGGLWRYSGITLPHWFVAALTLLLPTCWGIGYRSCRARMLRQPGLCPTCDYDLRATPDRCPECGTPAHQGHAAKDSP